MHSFAKPIAISALVIFAGCSSLSSINPFAKTDTKNAPVALHDFKTSISIKKIWSASVGSSGTNLFSPVQVGKVIYAGSVDGTLVKLDLDGGNEIWRIHAGIPLTAGVGADSSTVAVAGQKGQLLAFDLDGKLRWKVQASSEILTTPLVDKGLVIVRSIDNRVAAYDAISGARKWAVDRPLPSLTLRTVAGIAVTESMAIVAYPGGKVAALSLDSGAVRWEATAAVPKGATELERIADVSGTPAVMGQEVCTAAYQGHLGCYDIVSGAVRWSKDFSSEVGVSVDERFVFAVDTASAISAFARQTGSSTWRNDQLLHRQLSAPVSFDRAVVVADAFGYLHFLSREDGSFIGRVSTDGSQIIMPQNNCIGLLLHCRYA